MKNTQNNSETSEFYQNDTEESPEFVKKKRIGLHDYEGNKENVQNNGNSSFQISLLPPNLAAQSPMKKRGALVAIKPTVLEQPNEIKMNLKESYQEPTPTDDVEGLEASSLFESVYEFTGEEDQVRKHIKQEMKIFDLDYDIDARQVLELTPGEQEMIYHPTFDDIFNYVKYVAFKSKMEAEIPIIALIYIEKLLRTCGVLVNVHNWRRIVLITLWIASKIWDDDSLENVHFPKVMNDVSLKDISTLEKTFLNLIEYDVIIKGKEYAKYYFIMTTLGEESKKNPPWRLMNPSTIQKIETESRRMQEQMQNS